MSLIIAPVPITMLDHVWDKCVPHLEKVVKKSPSELSLETIRESLEKGNQMLFAISDGPEVVAVNVVETISFATGLKVLSIPITGGTRMDEWMERFLKIANSLAIDLGCTELRGMAVRKGWLRKLESYGWEPFFTAIRCPVKTGDIIELDQEKENVG